MILLHCLRAGLELPLLTAEQRCGLLQQTGCNVGAWSIATRSSGGLNG